MMNQKTPSKILFVTSYYPQECKDALTKESGNKLQAASNLFQESVIDGLNASGVDYDIVCLPALPAWPGYNSIYTPQGEIQIGGVSRGCYLSYCTLPILKQFSQRIVLRRYIREWCKANAINYNLYVLVYTQQSEFLGAAIDLKKEYPNLVVSTIITDLIEHAMEFASNRRFLKRIQVKIEAWAERRIFPKVDKYILLTEQMKEIISAAIGKYVVMEGIAPNIKYNCSVSDKCIKEDIRTLLYAGTFQEFGGLRMLIDAFRRTTDERFRLVLCGEGVLTNYVQQAAKEDSRIIYKGLVSHKEVLNLQQKSTLLINPRRPNGGITKYSFPSKTMEYLSSYTPMIGYRLEGIPTEYYQYFFTPNDLSNEALTQCINETLSLPFEQLSQRAQEAYDFVSSNKNSKAQISKILDFILE